MALTKLNTSSLPAGSMLKVAQTVKTDVFTTTSDSFVDITGLSVSITPSSSTNKIMIEFNIGAHDTNNAAEICYKIIRDSTAIAIADSGNGHRCTVGTTINPDRGETASMKFLDSPSTTSAITYKIQTRVSGGQTLDINKRGVIYGAISTITATEIAG